MFDVGGGDGEGGGVVTRAAEALVVLSESPARLAAIAPRRPPVFDIERSGLEIVAAAEWLLNEHGDLPAKEVAKPGFIKGMLLAEWTDSMCALPSPMRGKREVHGHQVTEADLYGLWRHLDRLRGSNTSASHYRARLDMEIRSRRDRELAEMRIPEAVKRRFATKPIMLWFVAAPDESDESDDDEPEVNYESPRWQFGLWLAQRKHDWRLAGKPWRRELQLRIRRRRAARVATGADIQPLPPPVHWLEPHPQNHSAWLTDEAAAGLRHHLAETRCTGRSLPLSFALDYTIMFREPPPPLAILSRMALRHAFMRLHARDIIDLGEFVSTVLEDNAAALIYHVFDDTPDGSCERHAHLVTIWDPELKSPS